MLRRSGADLRLTLRQERKWDQIFIPLSLVVVRS